MKSMIAKVSAALVFASMTTAASAQVYGEVGYLGLSYEESGLGDVDIGTLGATVGYEINKNVAVEGMFAVGVNDDHFDYLGTSVKVEGKHTYGVFVKPKATIGDSVEVYAKLGWADSKVEYSIPGASATDTGSDFAYGVGAQFNITPKAYVSAGYLNVYDKDDVTVDGWTVSVGYKF